ncbi:MAG TPA: M23 family metallopeptidase [Candidatus Saccharimonadales bacterium]|nr:M23 family metallopeptidase [Candidatus Saccharimonadales bacterium]
MTSNHKTKLRLPFAGQWLVMNGGDTREVNHHSGIRPQNFAFDFTIIDDSGHDHKSDGKKCKDYYAFGRPILAPADGAIVETVDGVRDNEPGFGNYLAGAGNFIIIKHRPDEFSFIAHLKQGSVKVKSGESVKAGQKLGECGNSGQSFAPHLHYHLQDSILFDQYKVIYADKDRRKAPFPTTLDIEQYVAGGIKAHFTDIKLADEPQPKKLYSPVRGEVVGNS